MSITLSQASSLFLQHDFLVEVFLKDYLFYKDYTAAEPIYQCFCMFKIAGVSLSSVVMK